MEWSNQKVLVFLEYLKEERVIWDPNDLHHGNKHKASESWRRISKRLDNTPIKELKAKKRSLMATFRPLLKKKIISVMGGAISDEDVYQPTWFAYDILESFMGFIYDEWSVKMENGNQQADEASDQDQDDCMNDRENNSMNDRDDPVSEDDSGRNENSRPKLKRRKRNHNTVQDNTKVRTNPSMNYEEKIAQNNINESFQTLKKVLEDKRDEDDCDLYAKLLAKKLRKYPGQMRLKLMYSIDGILIDNPNPAVLQSSNASHSISSSSSHPLPADPLSIYAS